MGNMLMMSWAMQAAVSFGAFCFGVAVWSKRPAASGQRCLLDRLVCWPAVKQPANLVHESCCQHGRGMPLALTCVCYLGNLFWRLRWLRLAAQVVHQEKCLVCDFPCVHADVLGVCCGLVVEVRGFWGVERCYDDISRRKQNSGFCQVCLGQQFSTKPEPSTAAKP